MLALRTGEEEHDGVALLCPIMGEEREKPLLEAINRGIDQPFQELGDRIRRERVNGCGRPSSQED